MRKSYMQKFVENIKLTILGSFGGGGRGQNSVTGGHSVPLKELPSSKDIKRGPVLHPLNVFQDEYIIDFRSREGLPQLPYF